MAENQTINPAPIDPQAEEGTNLDMARVPRNQGSDPKKPRAIILGQGFVVNGRQIIVHRITDKVRAKSKVVIEGFHLNAYNKVQLGVGQNWFNPVDFKKAYGDSEPISFLIPNFSRSLKDGDHIFVRLLSASYPVANGFITKYLIYSTKTEEEEAAEAGEKAGKGTQGKAGEGGAGGPTEIATGAMGAVLGGITGALFKSKEEEKKFEPQRVASRELASEGLDVSKEGADYDVSEPIKAEEAVETSEIPVSGTAEISTGAQVIGQGTTGIAQTISQGGTISEQGTVTVSQEGTQSISGQQTVSASGTVSGGQKISVQGTVSGQERGETTGTVSVKQQAGVSGAASVQERTEVSGKESVRQETRKPEGAS
ncbi:MAG: hypothetical protein NTX98_03375, partial [Candidatus Doudnabacteria bacterium]|nr:hypothetical protein [Candidatus Doudnabacteria bacterium]